jgi:hypothetical protein
MQRSVVHGVAQHLLDVVARLVERDRLGVDRALERPIRLPLARAPRSGVVRRRREDRAPVELVEHVLQVARSKRDVHLHVGHARRRVVLHAGLARDPARRRRHELHQAGGAGERPHVGAEPALLPHETEHVRLLEALGARLLGEHAAVRREEAHVEVVRADGAVGGVDRAIPELGAARDLRGGEQLLVIHAAQRPVPLPDPLGALVEPQQREPALQPGVGRHPGDLLGGEGVAARRDREGLAELLARELAVKVMLAGKTREQHIGGILVPGHPQRAASPVRPSGLGALQRGHLLDDRARRRPVLLPQRRAHPPLELLFGQRRAVGLRVPLERARQVALRALRRDLSPHPRLILGRQPLLELARPVAERELRVAARGAGERVEQQLPVHALLQVELVGALDEVRGLLPDAVERTLVGRFAGGQVMDRPLRGRDLSRLEQDPHAVPDVARGELASRDLRFGQQHAALGQVARGGPHPAELIEGGRVAAPPARLERVAGEFRFVAGERRILALERFPLVALAELPQPVATHLVGDVRALLPDEEVAHLRSGQLLELHAQLVVLDVRLEDVALEMRGLLRQLRVLADAERLARREEAVVLGERRRPRFAVRLRVQRRRRGDERDGEREATDRKAYHLKNLICLTP